MEPYLGGRDFIIQNRDRGRDLKVPYMGWGVANSFDHDGIIITIS